MEEFALYVDDSGSPKPNHQDKTPYFSMGGILLRRRDTQQLQDTVLQFKKQWNIPPDIALHASKIRAKKDTFAWLGKLSDEDLNCFHCDLAKMIVSCPIVVHACVISRSGYCERYVPRYGSDTWEMMRTAFTILLERAAKFVSRDGGKLMVFYEKMGKREDRLLKSYFEELRTNGHPFNKKTAEKYVPLSVSELSQRLSGIEGKGKEHAALQVADLCLYPVAQGRERPSNRAFASITEAKLLVDNHLSPDEMMYMGIKYSCFD